MTKANLSKWPLARASIVRAWLALACAQATDDAPEDAGVNAGRDEVDQDAPPADRQSVWNETSGALITVTTHQGGMNLHLDDCSMRHFLNGPEGSELLDSDVEIDPSLGKEGRGVMIGRRAAMPAV